MDIQLGHFPQVLLLVFARIAAIIHTVPFFGRGRAPVRIRTLTALMISVVILPSVSAEWIEVARNVRTLPQIAIAMLSEVLLGSCVGLVCNFFVAACTMGGTIVGRGSSLMMARSMDPDTGVSNTIVAQIVQTVFLLVVLLSNGHLMILKMSVWSFGSIVEPMSWGTSNCFQLVIHLGSFMLRWGLRLAIPVMSVSLILQVSLGLMARMAPNFNVLFLSLPLRLAIGICVFGLSLRFGAGLLENMMEDMLSLCSVVLTG